MEISYNNKKLKQLCEDKRAMDRQLGTAAARKLRARLSDLDAVARVSDLVVGRPHPLKGDRAGQFSLSLAGGKRLVFAPNHTPVPVKDDGSIDWACVIRVEIVFIGDYHD